MTQLASKAKQADILCQRLLAVRSVEEKRVYAEQLDQLWPDVRCRVSDEGWLRVFFVASRVQRVPRILGYSAHYIEKVFDDGSSRVTKDKVTNNAGHTFSRANIELVSFPVHFKLCPAPTAWERIMGDDDF